MPQSILVVDDHPMCTAALTMAAHAVDPATEVRVAASLGQAEELARARRPDLVLLDLVLPDAQGFSGVALMRALCPETPVAVVSSRDDEQTVRKLAGLGARGFISKTAAVDRMIAAIRALLAGGQWFPDGLLAERAADGHDDAAERIGSLSLAQLRVLRAIAEGAQNKQIAYDLDLAIPTVKSHLAAIFRKLGVTNRTQAVLALKQFDAEEAA